MKGIVALHVASLLILLVLTSVVQAQEIAGSSALIHQQWVDSASIGLDPRAIDTLHRIRGENRRLLALRAYLRAGNSLSARWSWSEDQLARYPATLEGKSSAADLDAVVAAFTKANPGYSLQVNRQPRSLEVQLAHWNDNPSVGIVADALTRFLDQRFDGSLSMPAAQLRNALTNWVPTLAATRAAPGLSAHGQGRAFDFVVFRNGQMIAGPKAASAHSQWDEAGWTRKLGAAIASSGKPFTGPLRFPYEPWHYAYVQP